MARSAAGPLDLSLHGTHQRVEPERHLDRTDLRRAAGEDQIAGQGELEAAAHARPVHRRDDRERERLEPVEELDGRDRHRAPLHRPVEHRDVRTGAEVLEAAAQEHGPGACLFGLVEPAEHTIHQLDAEQVVRRELHRDDGERSVVFDGHRWG